MDDGEPESVAIPLEAEERSADAMYDASFDALRTGFTAAVSHELRTPLARILALLDNADLPGADVDTLLEQARAEVEHAGALIDEILFLSELESGKEVVALGRTNALPVLENVVADLASAAARAGIEVVSPGRRRRRPAASPADAADDRREPRRERDPLRRARVALHARRLARRRCRRADGGRRRRWRRRGRLPRLFERFYRADAARTTRGTGLGLAIVKHIVVAAGGDVEADGGTAGGLQHPLHVPA